VTACEKLCGVVGVGARLLVRTSKKVRLCGVGEVGPGMGPGVDVGVWRGVEGVGVGDVVHGVCCVHACCRP
jgi:hypothetical protein